MLTHAATNFRPPANWQDFEKCSEVLFGCILNDKRGIKRNGRQGQSQHGVDIHGRMNGRGIEWIGVQCKGKNDNYGNKITKNELRTEVEKTDKFKPSIRVLSDYHCAR